MAARSKSAAAPPTPDLAPIAPMEALLVETLPEPPGWQFEPKWDGLRAIVARDGDNIEIWSKAGKPLGRYFPEVIACIRQLGEMRLLLDGELVIPIDDHLSFDALQARLHPAASRIAKLSQQTPAQLILFDCLRIGRKDLQASPLAERRNALEVLAASLATSAIILSPASTSAAQAKAWLATAGGALDGVIAKALGEPYRPGERAMRKVKQLRTADCVVGGYRLNAGGEVASLLLGLFDDDHTLDVVGFCSAFNASDRRDLRKIVAMHEAAPVSPAKHQAALAGGILTRPGTISRSTMT